MEQFWIVLNVETAQAWSNECGWTDLDGDDYDLFDDDEKATLRLPIGGEWRAA